MITLTELKQSRQLIAQQRFRLQEMQQKLSNMVANNDYAIARRNETAARLEREMTVCNTALHRINELIDHMKADEIIDEVQAAIDDSSAKVSTIMQSLPASNTLPF